MAERTIYECGCAQQGEQYWPCRQHKPSAQPCGCDFGMTPPHRCEVHQREYEDMVEEALRMCGR